MRRIGVVTTSRADYGIYRPLLRGILQDPGLELSLIVAGMHLCPAFGLTVQEIAAEGLPIAARVETILDDDTPLGVAGSLGLGVARLAPVLAELRPDLLLVLGDRFEMFAAACAATPLKIPLAHLHGGELTMGAMDDAFRHAMTKLSHLHLVATEQYAARVRQMGEEPWRVTVCGALGLVNLRDIPLLEPAALQDRLGLELEPAPLLVTFHPATLEQEDAPSQARELLAALEPLRLPLVFSLPNADAGGRELGRLFREFVAGHPKAVICDNLGTQAYFSLMARAAAMVGNSSSGIIEAPSFKLPVVNIGSRQDGRQRAANVIDVACRRDDIARAIARACSPAFRQGIKDLVSPYYQPDPVGAILERLMAVDLGPGLINKRFTDLTRSEDRP
ncbi:MAG: UDP-N-acetylglucosamine 2-epimerase [Pseudomonadota bacterium]